MASATAMQTRNVTATGSGGTGSQHAGRRDPASIPTGTRRLRAAWRTSTSTSRRLRQGADHPLKLRDPLGQRHHRRDRHHPTTTGPTRHAKPVTRPRRLKLPAAPLARLRVVAPLTVRCRRPGRLRWRSDGHRHFDVGDRDPSRRRGGRTSSGERRGVEVADMDRPRSLLALSDRFRAPVNLSHGREARSGWRHFIGGIVDATSSPDESSRANARAWRRIVRSGPGGIGGWTVGWPLDATYAAALSRARNAAVRSRLLDVRCHAPHRHRYAYCAWWWPWFAFAFVR